MSLFYCFTPTFKLETFDETEMFENEKLFYHDQLGPRIMYISEEVDNEYEAARAEKIAKFLEARESYEAEISYIFGEDNGDDGASAAEPSPSTQFVCIVSRILLVCIVKRIQFFCIVSKIKFVCIVSRIQFEV